MDQQDYKYAHVANEIRRQILTGSLASGTRLLPAKKLGALLGCHQHTVRHAFKILLQEGYLESRSGSGTFIRNPRSGSRAEAFRNR